MTTGPGGPLHDRLREQLGAYALGQLEGAERDEVATHLDTCPACRAELAALAPLAGPLARIDPDAPHAVADEPTAARPGAPDGFAGVLDRLRREPGDEAGLRDDVDGEAGDGPGAVSPAVPLHARGTATRRRAVRPVLAAAAAAVIGLAGVGIGLAVAGAGEPDVEPVTVQALDPAVRASAGTIDHTWGVEMVLTGSGFAEGQVYEVTVLDRGGRPVPAGAFRGTGPTEMVCRLNSSVLREQAGGFVVTDADGDEVLRSQFS
ncbi:zf-HC2 domain-containing protein [Actinomycetospora lemnae]|uniref:Zf-HC2 domain-containing protein n=1 Tax=Actinomycetospora lemnae TaxID=3019891 RepID=A0ABT5SLK1_9PSEU|nr:zf-HC2 domain-containing protein [Actinomycetospora sp. DW7H6]MDD7963719.1 zf-HC2 domain-containing protein [Actinomycetospora sp. DW7H6]